MESRYKERGNQMQIKILFFLMSLEGGGAEKVLVNMVNQLTERYPYYDITVQTLFDKGINKQYLSKNVNYKYVFKNIVRGNRIFLKLFNTNFLYRKMIKDDDFDIVVSFCQGPSARIVSGCTSNVTTVQWIHNEFKSKEEITRLYRNESEADNSTYHFDNTVYVANSVKNSFERIFPKIKNGVTLYNINNKLDIVSRYTEEIEDYKFNNKNFHFVSVGRFVPQKAFDRLIRIMNLLVNVNHMNVDLIILGDGPLRKELEDGIKNYNLQNHVTLLGYKSNPYKYVAAADIFVCSSIHEGYSTAVTESILVETPVITTACSGMKELLGNNEYGIIVKNEEESLYDELKQVLSNKEKIEWLNRVTTTRKKQILDRDELKEVDSFFIKLVKEKK